MFLLFLNTMTNAKNNRITMRRRQPKIVRT